MEHGHLFQSIKDNAVHTRLSVKKNSTSSLVCSSVVLSL